MKVEVWNTKTNELVCTAKITFGLDVYIVHECNGWNIQELTEWMNSRIDIPYDYKMDIIILKKLQLFNKQREFGRMSDAIVLYSILNYFAGKDEYQMYPSQLEYISMIDLDPRYSNIYLWKPKNS